MVISYSGHPWIKEDGEAPDTPLDIAVLERLKQFRAMNKFKKVALRVVKPSVESKLKCLQFASNFAILVI